MSEWIFISKNEVQHVNGYKLTLNDGYWWEPKDIRPTIPKELHLSPLEVATKMREGLKFASQEAISQQEVISIPVFLKHSLFTHKATCA